MIAEMIQAETGADIIRLDTAVPYEGTDQEIVAQGKAEVNEGYTPKLKPLEVSLDAYDTIILGPLPGGTPWPRQCYPSCGKTTCQGKG